MGQKYASYNAQEVVTGFYDSIDSPPPAIASVIAITDAEWQGALSCAYPPVTVVNGALVIPTGPTLAQAQSAQVATLRSACQSAITGGFSSSALGSAYTYGSGVTDQANLNTIASSPTGGSLWCETGGSWTMKPHTQAQAQAVLSDFVAWLNACQSKLAALTAEVEAATTVEAVKSITW